MADRNYSNTATEATLSGSIAASDTSIVLASYAGFPTPPFTAVLERGTAVEEVVLVNAESGGTVTVSRGYDGTTAKSHAAGANFLHVTIAKDFEDANAHQEASAGVHGVTGAVVGTTDIQTLSNKTLNSPTITAPTIAGPTVTGTAAHQSATYSGTISVTGTSTFAGMVAASGSVTGAFTVSGLLTAAGDATVTGTLTAGALSVSGTSSFTGAVTVPTPTLGSHPATKTYADALGVSAATVSTIMRRDSAGRTAVVDGSAASDAVNKGQLDAVGTRVTGLEGRYWQKTGSAAPVQFTTPPKMLVGTVNAVFSGATFVIPTIDYTALGFATAPRVIASTDQGNDYDTHVSAHAVTTTGCWLVTRAPTAITGTVPVHYIVIGR